MVVAGRPMMVVVVMVADVVVTRAVPRPNDLGLGPVRQDVEDAEGLDTALATVRPVPAAILLVLRGRLKVVMLLVLRLLHHL